MIINYTPGFLDKLSIPQYPLKGFWFQLVNSNVGLNIKESWLTSASDIYYSNTYAYSDEFRINIKLTNKNDINNTNNRIYLYAIDLLKYKDIVDLANGSTNSKNNELLTQLAAIVTLDDIPDWSISNIITFKVPNRISCSFMSVTMQDSVHVEHYISNNIGSTNYYKVTTDDLLIDYDSGQARLREIMTRSKPDELLGTMTIKDSGIIQL